LAINGLAEISAASGGDDEAESRFAEALALRRAIGHRDGEAKTLRSQGALYARLGRTGEARVTLGKALSIARDLPLPGVELLATAELATLPDGDVAAALAALAAHEGRAGMQEAMEVRFLLWQATRDPAHLVEAKRRLDFLVEHAPADCRESMVANVRLHHEIAAAAREHGTPLAADSKQPGPTGEAR
jgi:tetratricopeptide (TPR) repeat protein